ncbi:MAG: tetratricopeptide repeat protein, partial [Bryobacteraceae bacterium]
AQNDLAGAEAILLEASTRAPRSVEPALALADFYVVLGKTAQAEAQLSRALQLDPNHGPALLRLAELRLRAGKKAEAEDILKRLSAIPDKSYRPAHALFLLHEGRTAEAIAELERLHRDDPSDRDVRTRLVAAYLVSNRAADARKVLDKAIERNARDVQALLQRGALLVREGKWLEAEQDLAKVLRIQPESAEAHYHLAAVRRGQGESASARQELAEAVRLNPSLLAARLELAGTLLREKSAQAALDLLEQAPPPQKNDLRFLVARNSALMALGDFARAREGVKQGLAVARTPELLTQDGNLRLLAKDFAGARASLEEALQRDPENLAALDLLASTYAAQKQPEAALGVVRKHAAAHPASARIQFFAGEWLLRAG